MKRHEMETLPMMDCVYIVLKRKKSCRIERETTARVDGILFVLKRIEQRNQSLDGWHLHRAEMVKWKMSLKR